MARGRQPIVSGSWLGARLSAHLLDRLRRSPTVILTESAPSESRGLGVRCAALVLRPTSWRTERRPDRQSARRLGERRASGHEQVGSVGGLRRARRACHAGAEYDRHGAGPRV